MIKHRPGQYGRLDKDDVGHRQKSRDPRQQFRARVGLVFRKTKESFEHSHWPTLVAAKGEPVQREFGRMGRNLERLSHVIFDCILNAKK